MYSTMTKRVSLVCCYIFILLFITGCAVQRDNGRPEDSCISVNSLFEDEDKSIVSQADRTDGLLDSSVPGQSIFVPTPIPEDSFTTLSLEDLQNENGDFLISGYFYDTRLDLISALYGLDTSIMEKGPQVDGDFTVTCVEGEMKLLDAIFQHELTFRDGRYSGSCLFLEAEEGEDITNLYEQLYSQLDLLYGLGEEQKIKKVVFPLDNGRERYFDSHKFSSVHEEEGERSTGILFSGYEENGAIVRIELDVYRLVDE